MYIQAMLQKTTLAAAFAIVATAQAQAPTSPQTQALTRLFSTGSIQQEWFAPSFLAQIPFATLEAQLNGVMEQFGKLLKVDTYQDKPLLVFENGTLLVTSAPLDAEGRFTSFGAMPGPSQTALTPEQQQLGVQTLEKLLAVNPLDTALFGPEFLANVSAEQLRAAFAEYRKQLGDFEQAKATASGWELQFQKGSLPITSLNLNDQGLISGLRVGAILPKFGNFDEARAALAQLPGQKSLLVQEVGQAPLVSVNASRPMGVASAFKLAILSELQAQIKAGTLRWTDELTLTDADKSLPSGTLQDAPAGGKYTLQDLATRMIRDSDNTATDLLLNKVGREAVETRSGQSAMPSTREAFALKNPANLELLRAYRTAGLNTAARREVLGRAASAPLPGAAVLTSGKTLARDVEWFISTQRLCTLINEVAALPEMQINPGIANKDDFKVVSYKGGSEVGVLNLTTQVTTKAGKTYCISATWNNAEPLDEAALYGLYAGVLNLVK